MRAQQALERRWRGKDGHHCLFRGKNLPPQRAGQGCCWLGWAGRRWGWGVRASYASAPPRAFVFLSITHFLFPLNHRSSALGWGLSSLCFLPREPGFQAEQPFQIQPFPTVCVGGGPRHPKGGELPMFSFCASVLQEDFAGIPPGMREWPVETTVGEAASISCINALLTFF